jgi:hypothetical protein
MKFRFLALSAVLGTAAIVGSCTKTETVVETKIVHDTIVTAAPHGPAWIRFISMLPEAGTVVLWTDREKANPPFTNALSYSSTAFLPILADTPMTLYADFFVNGIRYLDSINIGAQSQYSLTTAALFVRETHDETTMNAVFVNDSARVVPAKAGECYVRFIDGMADYPASQPQLCLAFDSHDNSIWREGNQPQPVWATSTILNYTLIPVGRGATHHVLYATTTDGEVVDSVNRTFTEGHYYTVRVWGRKAQNTNRMSVDEE